jgi:NAD(P)-dependent dehydrogenase (short-subunit alcohol dehydrogenase family)
MSHLDFTGRVVIVTGAGRGIGRAHAELLAARGAAVVVNDTGGATDGRRTAEDPAAEVVAGIIAAGGRAVAVRESVATPEGAAAIVDAALTAFGALDAVINNAGIYSVAPWQEVPPQTFHDFLGVHFFGSLYVSLAAWPQLAASGRGRIVNTVSGAMLGVPDMMHYGPAKGAVYGLTRHLAVAGAEDGIKVYLAHESCSLNGEVLNAGGGAVSRMVMVNTAGIADAELTPESVSDRLEEIMTVAGAVPAPLTLRTAVSPET